MRTATRYATAVSTCARVLYVNRMILYVTCTLGFFCILITAALIYQVSNKDDREENEIHSIPDAMCAVSRRSVAPPPSPVA